MKSEIISHIPEDIIAQPGGNLNSKGFTLVELLFVVAILGVVMGAMFTLYQTHQRSAITQEEVVEVQQNLRVSMESITRDLEMAGFLVPSGRNPLEAATATSLTINTASAVGRHARINADATTVATETIFTVDSPEAVDIFDNGDYVRIIRPQDRSQPITGPLTVNGVSRTTPSLKISTTAGIEVKRGDVIVRTTDDAFNPNTIVYSLGDSATLGVLCPAGQFCIARMTNEGTPDQDTQIVANNIKAAGLQFSYRMKDGTETSAPADRSQIRAVRVTISGETVTTVALSGAAKEREVTSVVAIRNR